MFNADSQLLQNLDLSQLNTIIPTWKNQKFPNSIPLNVCREILEEIFRISFNVEVLLADHFLYVVNHARGANEPGEVIDELDASSREDRNLKVIEALMFDQGLLGFTSTDNAVCQRTLFAFYRVMCGWTRMPRMHHSSRAKVERLGGPVLSSMEEVERLEYYIADHYIITFSDFFKRAPVLPHAS